MTRRTRRVTGAAFALPAAVAMIAAAAAAVGAAPPGRADGGTVYFAITHQVGKNQYAAGQISDKLSERVRSRL
jgi:Spy/CpxP family protein refolding chaperone